MLEREAKREKNLETSAREKRLKAQQKRPASGITTDTEKVSDHVDELLKQAEIDFQQISAAA